MTTPETIVIRLVIVDAEPLSQFCPPRAAGGPPLWLLADRGTNHGAQATLDGFPVERNEHDRHRLRLRIIAEAQSVEDMAGVGHAEPSLIAFKHAGEGREPP
jgi:hypothetical protein